MSSTYGERFRFTIFGQSHGPAIGVTIEGIPAGLTIDMDRLQAFLDRRAPGRNEFSTPRKEADRPKFLSGLVGNVTCGVPLTAIIENTNTRSGDYEALRDNPRPGHADWPARIRYNGHEDPAGGGHFSGRLTAPLCIAGGIALQALEQLGVTVGAHIVSIGGGDTQRFDPVRLTAEDLKRASLEGPTEYMAQIIQRVKAHRDSIGGVIECGAVGVPAGWGDPMFGGMENRISQVVFGIPAVKAIEFGAGFRVGAMVGSDNNDPWIMENGVVKTTTNNHGGILGGITTGMPVIFRCAVKPTPSIAAHQHTLCLRDGQQYAFNVPGRHDPCIVPRAVPVVEAAMAAALYDAYLCGK